MQVPLHRASLTNRELMEIGEAKEGKAKVMLLGRGRRMHGGKGVGWEAERGGGVEGYFQSATFLSLDGDGSNCSQRRISRNKGLYS